MFVDEARIRIRAGRGGDGLVAFRREKYVPRGGPSGGDGGDGGDVVFVADPGLSTLLDFRYRRHFAAEDGEAGGPKNRAGRRGDDLVVPVPVGTVVYDDLTGRPIADLSRPWERAVIARGGRGGRGNARFATSTERAPRFAERGEPGQELTVRLELKLLADAGLVGQPNAGKSTFLARVSAARPKTADYPFTTLVPNLGVVAVPGREGASFVLADIPGLIRGAHEGAGLGDRFLRHIERTRVLVHLVDVSPLAGLEPVRAYREVRRELERYDPVLAARPEVVVATKMDVPGAEEGARRLEEELARESHPGPLYRASPLTGEGIPAVLHAVADLLAATAAPGGSEAAVQAASSMGGAGRGRSGFDVSREGDAYVVRGEDVERMVLMTDLSSPEALRHLHYVLKRRGLHRALRRAGARPGDTVRVGEFEFLFTE
ncbi:MAG: GTPase ObgE [Firmicutes bacterium]|nr:GTPase ObgE [Bacillota bacterium]